ncbi:MAG: alpha/beta fold hydrolase [Desulfobacca sp.]|uniref:alpha/beta fold hydrolase n=1 Tax=Desulfobacca sp. TaxID=2067990 RepID=UPI00404A5675
MKHLILLHGWATDSRIWTELRPALAGVAELWTPDLPVWQADWLLHKLQGLPPAQTVLVGWSLGAMLALQVCAAGFRPATLVLLAGCASFCRRPDYSLGWPVAVVRGMRQRLRTVWLEVVQDFHRQLLSPGENVRPEALADLLPQQLDPAWLAAGLDYLQHTDLRPQLPAVAAGEIVIVQGSADRIMTAAQAHFLAAQLPGARLVLLPRAGHALMVSRSPEVVNLLAPFLV